MVIATAIIVFIATIAASVFSSFDSRNRNEALLVKLEQFEHENIELLQDMVEIVQWSSKYFDAAESQLASKKYEEAMNTLTTATLRYDDLFDTENSTGAQSNLQNRNAAAGSTVAAETNHQREDVDGDVGAAVVDESLRGTPAGLKKTYDGVEGITWYFDPSVYNLAQSKVELYIGQREEGPPWLRFKIYHRYGSDLSWLFIDSYVFKIDGERFQVTPKFDQIRRDDGNGAKWEWYDNWARDWKPLVNRLISGDTALLRCDGDSRVVDRTITTLEKSGLRNVLDAFISMGGEW
jgi:hypothetical protein